MYFLINSLSNARWLGVRIGRLTRPARCASRPTPMARAERARCASPMARWPRSPKRRVHRGARSVEAVRADQISRHFSAARRRARSFRAIRAGPSDAVCSALQTRIDTVPPGCLMTLQGRGIVTAIGSANANRNRRASARTANGSTLAANRSDHAAIPHDSAPAGSASSPTSSEIARATAIRLAPSAIPDRDVLRAPHRPRQVCTPATLIAAIASTTRGTAITVPTKSVVGRDRTRAGS